MGPRRSAAAERRQTLEYSQGPSSNQPEENNTRPEDEDGGSSCSCLCCRLEPDSQRITHCQDDGWERQNASHHSSWPTRHRKVRVLSVEAKMIRRASTLHSSGDGRIQCRSQAAADEATESQLRANMVMLLATDTTTATGYRARGQSR
jgi:hypothetical protein